MKLGVPKGGLPTITVAKREGCDLCPELFLTEPAGTIAIAPIDKATHAVE